MMPERKPETHPASQETALTKIVGAQPSVAEMSMAEGAAVIIERVGADPTAPDVQVLAWGWAATCMESIRLMREKVRQLDHYARDHCAGNYDEAQFQIANSGKYKNIESRIRVLRKDMELWEQQLRAVTEL